MSLGTHPTGLAARSPRPDQVLESVGTVAIWVSLGACAAYGAWSVASVAMRAGPADHGPLGTGLFTLIWSGLAVGLVARILALRSKHGRPAESTARLGLVERMPDPISQPAGSASHEAPRRWQGVLVAGLGLGAVLAIYHGIFGFGVITWGDWNYYLNSGAVRQMFPLPSFWAFSDLGHQNILGLPLAPIEVAMGLAARLGLPYSLIERLFFYFPAVLLSYLGCHILARKVGSGPVAAAIAGVFFAANPYAEQLFAGGQLTVGMGYALAPWTAWLGLRTWRRPTWRKAVAFGTLVGVQGWFDPREALLAVMSGGVVVVVLLLARPTLVRARLAPWPVLLGTGALAVTQLPWVLPALLAIRPALPGSYTTTSALQALSYMTLGDGLTIFHPFWPFFEHPARIAGVAVLWIVVPAVACLALLTRRTSLAVLGASAVYLVFAALTSGSNPPFGPLNLWLFSHVPGLDVFRDPSPYFGPAALAVSLLVGLTIGGPWHAPRREQIGKEHGADPAVDQLRTAALVLFPALILVASFPALSGLLGDNLKPRSIPGYYVTLASFLRHTGGGSVLWIPDTSRFAVKSAVNPSVSAWNLEQLQGVGFPPGIGSPAQWLSHTTLTGQILQRYGIRYIVVRTDPAPYSTLSISYLATRNAALADFKHLPHRVFGPLDVYRVPRAPAAPFSSAPANEVLTGVPPGSQTGFRGYPLAISTPGSTGAAAGVSSLFPTAVSAVTGHPGQSLSVAEPASPSSVVEVMAAGQVLFGRSLPTVQSIYVGDQRVSAPVAAPWVRIAALGAQAGSHGIVVTVHGLSHYISGPSVLSGRPAVAAVVPDSSGSTINVRVSTLGASVISQKASADGVTGWGDLGNEFNYNHVATLAQAGISVSADGSCGPGPVTLTAREDAAGISALLLSAPNKGGVVTAQIRWVSGPPPILRVDEPTLGLIPVGTARSNHTWTPVTFVAGGGVSGLQLLLYASGHGPAVGCVRDASVLPVTRVTQGKLPVASALELSPSQLGAPQGKVSYSDVAANDLQLLSTTTLAHGLGGWGSVGNGFNYNHASLRADGISAYATASRSGTLMALKVAIGAASVSQNFVPFADSDEYRISVTYRATAGAHLEAQLYSQGATVPSVALSFPAATGGWATEVMTAFSYSLGPSASAASPVDSLTLLLWPGTTPTALAEISRVTLTQQVPKPQLVLSPASTVGVSGASPTGSPRWMAGVGRDSFSVSVPRRLGTRLLVLWQSYSPGWVAVGADGRPLTHVVVNGWANGFVLSGRSTQEPIEVTFAPQRWEAIGLGILTLCLLLGAAMGLALGGRSLWKWHHAD